MDRIETLVRTNGGERAYERLDGEVRIALECDDGRRRVFTARCATKWAPSIKDALACAAAELTLYLWRRDGRRS